MSDTNPLPRAREALERIQLCWASETEQPREEDYGLIATALDAAERERHALDAALSPSGNDLENMAAAVHVAYLSTCQRLGWEVKPSNAVPYVSLSHEAKELDRASVFAVLNVVRSSLRTPDGGPDDADG